MRRMMLPLMLFVVACQPPTVEVTVELTDAEKAAIAEEVNAMHVAMWDAWRAADLDRGMSFMDTSADLGWGFAGEIRYGADNIVEWFRPMLAGVERQEIDFPQRRTVVLGKDVVCVMVSGAYTAYDSGGSAVGSSQLAATEVWVRRNGEWKLAAGHESVPVPEVQ